MVSNMQLSGLQVNSLNCFSLRALKSKIKSPASLENCFGNSPVKQTNVWIIYLLIFRSGMQMSSPQ